jgi:hypothetical protein
MILGSPSFKSTTVMISDSYFVIKYYRGDGYVKTKSHPNFIHSFIVLIID